jgi:uncharacterized protein YifE (UPF0438 family)
MHGLGFLHGMGGRKDPFTQHWKAEMVAVAEEDSASQSMVIIIRVWSKYSSCAAVVFE